MGQSPPASLVRLREADVVRLCGLDAAARGMDYAARHQLNALRRLEARLDAVVGDDVAARVWVELAGDGSLSSMRWSCSIHADTAAAPGEAHAGEPGCAHVAGILTAWIRRPHDFLAPVAPTPLASATAPVADPPRPRLGQPPLLASPAKEKPKAPVTLSDELARLPTAEALAIARRVFGAELAEHEARLALAALLTDSARVRALLARLDVEAADLLGEIALLGGTITSNDLDALGVRAELPPSAMRDHVALLRRHALLFPIIGTGIADAGGRHEHPWGRFTGWRIPPEICAALGSALPLAPLALVRPHGPPILAGSATSDPASRREHSLRVVPGSPRALILALALLARAPQPYGVASSGAAPRSTREEQHPSGHRQSNRTTSLLAGELDTRVIAEFARGAGVPIDVARMARRVLLWARENGTDSPLHDLASVPLSQRPLALRAGFRLWRFADAPGELVDMQPPETAVCLRYDTAHPAFRPAVLAGEAARARQFILRLVERAQPQVWYALDALVELVWRLNPLFLRSRQVTLASPAWWLEHTDTRRPLRPTLREEWRLAEGAYIRGLVSGPLHRWGACDIATDTSGRPVAFRRSALGTYLLGPRETLPAGESMPPFKTDWGPAVLPTRDGALAVQPLVAGGELLGLLETWARISGVAGGRLVYTLMPELACAAFDHGLDPARLLERLRDVEGNGSPRAEALLTDCLAKWRAVYGHTRIESGWAVLEARDEVTLTEALAYVPEVAARCRRIAPEIVLVPPNDLPTVQTALAKRGYQL